MIRNRQCGRRDAGQATLELVAMLAAAAMVIVTVVGVLQHARVEAFVVQGVCRVQAAVQGGDAGACAVAADHGRSTGKSDPDDGLSGEGWLCTTFGIGCYSPHKEGGDPQPQDAPQPLSCSIFGFGCHKTADQSKVGIPNGLDPRSDMVKTLLSTSRGRDTLQWLHDNNIPIVVSDKVTGAYWDGTQMVIGKGYDDPSVIVHETNHAMATHNGTSADIQNQSKQDYVNTAINEEVAGTVKQIRAAKEFRAAGHSVAEQPLEHAFDDAYSGAKDDGKTDAEALAAATSAVSKLFFDGQVRTSTTNQPYTDYYTDAWNRVHPR